MGAIETPQQVQHFCGVIFSGAADIASVRGILETEFGPVEEESPVFPFDKTDYYEPEMGAALEKIFFSFEKLIDPADIVPIKIRTNEIEAAFAAEHNSENRIINLDPGYISHMKLVLATTKDCGHRIYIRDGIYAESTLQFISGSYTPFPWTYPDFRKQEYITFLNKLREKYKQKLRRAATG